jgi:hypothetical protein
VVLKRTTFPPVEIRRPPAATATAAAVPIQIAAATVTASLRPVGPAPPGNRFGQGALGRDLAGRGRAGPCPIPAPWGHSPMTNS